jgi:DNA-binding GntR family transcriptional regulator
MTFDDDDVDELLTFRLSIEVGALIRTVGHADETILKKMEETIEPFERLRAEGRVVAANPYDIKFHSLLLQASGSSLLSSLHEVIGRFFIKAERKFPQLGVRARPAAALEHRQLLEAIRAGDQAKAVSILHHHLQEAMTIAETNNEEDT